MDPWLFRCYLDEEGTDVIGAWFESLPDTFQALILTRLRFLQQTGRDGWNRPLFDTLGDECDGLGELRLKHKNVQWRVIGFASDRCEYTWVFVAKEVGDKFVPKNTCALAQKRRAEVIANRNRARDWEIDQLAT
jgi:hypothetical protein